MTSAEYLVRAVAPLGERHPSGYRFVSIIRFANAYSVTLSNDPTGYAGGASDRLVATQTQWLGAAARIANAIALRSEVTA